MAGGRDVATCTGRVNFGKLDAIVLKKMKLLIIPIYGHTEPSGSKTYFDPGKPWNH